MLECYKTIALLMAVLVLGGCSSKKSDEIQPQATSSSLPKTLKIDSYSNEYPTYSTFVWKDELLTSYTETTRNTTTNKDIVSTYEFTRNNKNLIISEKYTSEGADSKTTDYIYNTDGTEIKSGNFSKWIYNNKGQVIKIVYGSEGGAFYSFYSHNYDSNGQLTDLRYKESSYDYTNYLTEFTTVKNPLYILSEKTQFLKLSSSFTNIILSCSKMIPKSFNSYGAQYPYYITYSLDDQQRVNTITVTYNGNVLNKFTFGY